MLVPHWPGRFMPPHNQNEPAAQLELSLEHYDISGATISCGPEGTKFACTLGPLADEALTALDHAAQSGGLLCLRFPQPLLLDLLALERKDPRRIRIVGRIVGSPPHSDVSESA
jgi:hypothetical protein